MKVKIRSLEDIRTTHKIKDSMIIAKTCFYLDGDMSKLLNTTIEIDVEYLKRNRYNLYSVRSNDYWYIDLTLLEPFSRELVLAYVSNLKE